MYVYSLSFGSLDARVTSDLADVLARQQQAFRVVPQPGLGSSVRLVYETPDYVGESVVHKFCVPFEVRLERVAEDVHLASPESELRAMADISTQCDPDGLEEGTDDDANSEGTDVVSTGRAVQRTQSCLSHKRRRTRSPAGHNGDQHAQSAGTLNAPISAQAPLACAAPVTADEHPAPRSFGCHSGQCMYPHSSAAVRAPPLWTVPGVTVATGTHLQPPNPAAVTGCVHSSCAFPHLQPMQAGPVAPQHQAVHTALGIPPPPAVAVDCATRGRSAAPTASQSSFHSSGCATAHAQVLARGQACRLPQPTRGAGSSLGNGCCAAGVPKGFQHAPAQSQQACWPGQVPNAPARGTAPADDRHPLEGEGDSEVNCARPSSSAPHSTSVGR